MSMFKTSLILLLYLLSMEKLLEPDLLVESLSFLEITI